VPRAVGNDVRSTERRQRQQTSQDRAFDNRRVRAKGAAMRAMFEIVAGDVSEVVWERMRTGGVCGVRKRE
jgi:hypothetical protein